MPKQDTEELRRRRLSESSSDEQELDMASLQLEPGHNLRNVQKKKAVAKGVAKKHKVESSEDEEELEEADHPNVAKPRRKQDHGKRSKLTEDRLTDEESLHSEGEDFEAVEDGKPSKKRMKKEHEDCLHFFNTAKANDLTELPRGTKELAKFVIDNRPFGNFDQLELKLSRERGGYAVIESYIEDLRKRGILKRILDCCDVDSANVEKDFEQVKHDDTLPALLTKDYHLHRYQQEGLNWLIMMHKKKLNCILADEMGLGKTIQIIAFCAWLKEKGVKGTQLIIVPSSTMENWMAELERWCPALKVLVYYGSQDERYQIRASMKKKKTKADIILTTYNMSTKPADRKIYQQFEINYVIYDEGHMLKNCGSLRFQQLITIKSKRKILLTGTPLQNNLIELISLMYFVMKDVFDKYCDDMNHLLSHFKQQGGRVNDAAEKALYRRDRIDQARSILEPYVLRRLKIQVLSELPKKTEQTVAIEMTDHQVMLYNYQLELARESQDVDRPKLRDLYTGMMRLRQAANHPLMTRSVYNDDECVKIAQQLIKERPYEKKNPDHLAEDLTCLSDFQIHKICAKFASTKQFLLDSELSVCSGKCAYLDKELARIKGMGEKVLIFSQFTEMLDILQLYMEVRGHTFLRLDGSTPVLTRQHLINEYNNDDSMFVFLLSTRAGGLGINLTAANHIIIHDIDFNPYNDKQAEDRCHRLGQKKPVQVMRLVAKDSVEEGMERLAKRKLDLEREVTIAARGAPAAADAEETEGHSEEEEDANELRRIMTQARAVRRRK
ncbi:unnamed protein product, partial [Mesorhabditis spiculigera]